jgi:hypothetical protein
LGCKVRKELLEEMCMYRWLFTDTMALGKSLVRWDMYLQVQCQYEYLQCVCTVTMALGKSLVRFDMYKWDVYLQYE